MCYLRLIMANETKIQEIAKGKIQELQRSIAARREKISALIELDKADASQLSAWQVILEAEGKPDQVQGFLISAGSIIPSTSPVKASIHFGTPYSPEQTPEGYGQRAAVLRELLQLGQIYGVTPKDIKDKLTQMGIAVSASFAGNALARMKANGEVTERDGRYFWAGKSKYNVEVKKVEPAKTAGS